jgi:hypothetical protein
MVPVKFNPILKPSRLNTLGISLRAAFRVHPNTAPLKLLHQHLRNAGRLDFRVHPNTAVRVEIG